MPDLPESRHDSYAALRIPGFRRFIASLLAQTLGSQMQAVVVGWQVYALTHDPLALGLVGLAEALPFLSTVLFAGHAADRPTGSGWPSWPRPSSFSAPWRSSASPSAPG